MAINHGFTIEATACPDGKILLETYEYHDDIRKRILNEVMDTREKAVHDALIRLGWTPPVDATVTKANR